MSAHEALTARADVLAERVHRAMYVDPFWMARVADALRYGDPKIVTDYATWLQSVLTTRGMCTRHLDDNLERLARTINEDGLDEGGRPTEYLASAHRALHHLSYDAPPALTALVGRTVRA